MGSSQPVVLVLHRLTLDERARRMLHDLGVRVLPSQSLARTTRLIDEEADRVIVAFDLIGGGTGPERIVAASKLERAHPVDLVPASSRISGAVGSRAKRLGFEQAWVWPEGGLAEIMRLLEAHTEIRFRRVAPRAPVPPTMRTLELGDLRAELLNISASGALIETDAAGADLESLGFDLQVGREARLVLARVVTRVPAGDKVRLGVQFMNADASIRDAIDRFVQALNALTPKQDHPALEREQRVRARVRHGKRSDWFELERRDDGPLLVPKKPFFVPYQVGDAVVVEEYDRDGKKRAAPMRITGQMHLDPGIGSRIGWQVRPVTEGIDTGLPSGVGDEDTGEMVVRGLAPRTTIADVRDAWQQGRIRDLIPESARYVIAARPDARAHGDTQPRRVHTRTLFVRRKGGGVQLELQPYMWFEVVPLGGGMLGRSRSCALHFPVTSVSKRHARLFELDGVMFIDDIGSSNGTSIVRIDDDALTVHVLPGVPQRLRHGDVVLLGQYPLYFWERRHFEEDILPASSSMLR